MYYLTYLRKLSIVVVSILTLVSHVHSERYIVLQGPANQSMSGGLGYIGDDNIVHWESLNVTWYLNSNGAGDGLSFTQTRNAVQNSFDAWENVSTASIDFTYGGSTTSTWSIDSKNVHFWAESGDTIFGPPWNLPSYVLAVTVITINSDEEFTDVDIVFNGRNWTWRVNGNDYDIQAVSTHEIGHMIGLHHTEVTSTPRPTMYAYYEGTGSRSLESDDRIGVSFLYRGNLIANETFAGTDYYRWNVYVLSGVTLTIASGATINLNGNTLSIASSGTLDLGGDLAVTPGTLVFASSSDLDLNNHYLKMTGDGYIIDNGMTSPPDIVVKQGSYKKGYYSAIQSAINNASSGQWVYVAVGTYNENIYIGSNKVVYGASRNNTTINGTADVDGYLSRLHGFTVTGLISSFSGDAQTIDFVTAQNGIELDYGGGKYITSVIVTGNSTSAIDAYQTDPYIDGLMAITTGNDYGVYARVYADVVLDGYQIENKERGVYLYNRADAYIKDLEFCDNTYDIYAGYASYAEAVGSLWLVFSGDPAVKTYGDVDYPEEWDECDGFKKAIVASAPDAPDPAAQTANASDPGVSDYRKALAGLHAIKQKLMADLKADITPDPRNYQSDYETAIDQFKQVVAQYPGTPSSLKAIARVSSCNFSLDRPEAVYGYVNSVAKSPEFSAVQNEVLSFLIPYHVNQKDYDQALQLSDELLENSPDEDFACGILLGKGIIHRDGRHDLASAAEVFRKVISDYPDNPTALDAQDQLARMGESVPGGSPTEPETVEALALEGYPNPFNPSATIRFGLPESDRVTLIVYNLMGREVVRLLEGHQDAGWQAVVWDGRDAKGKEVPTGIYIARLVTPQNTKAIKLVMMK